MNSKQHEEALKLTKELSRVADGLLEATCLDGMIHVDCDLKDRQMKYRMIAAMCSFVSEQEKVNPTVVMAEVNLELKEITKYRAALKRLQKGAKT